MSHEYAAVEPDKAVAACLAERPEQAERPGVARDEHHQLVARLGLHQSQQVVQDGHLTGQLRTDTFSGASAGRVKLQQVLQLAARLRDPLADQFRAAAHCTASPDW